MQDLPLSANGTYTIAIVAGEASGDTLGAGLIQSPKIRYPQSEIHRYRRY